jgi:hypothetical protein
VVDGTGLENRHTRKGIGGSNPSLSASTLVVWHLQAGDTYTDSTIGEVVIVNRDVISPKECKHRVDGAIAR